MPDTNPEAVKLLSDDALREIETRRGSPGTTVWYHIPLTPTERDALVQTVRALRSELHVATDLCHVTTESLRRSESENAALREQLARCEGSRRVHELDNHHNALACGYCAGPIKEEITRLQSQLAQVTQERDDARERLKHKTRELVHERGRCHP